ncbi:uncharacterized protein [Euwallacea fornicatus]|uniref:uncharacterized protein n=1 Tax=Euwallacea fornicatus TaxID=995702 RepID=UPI00338D65BF
MTETAKQSLSDFQSTEELSEYLHRSISSLTLNPNSHNKEDDLKKSIHNFYRHKAIDHTFPVPEDVPDQVAKNLEIVYDLRRKDIINSVIKEKLVGSGHTLVENYDWKLKWVVGSSSLTSIREPICQIELICLTLGADLKPCRNSVSFECDLEGIEKLINVLNSVKEKLSQS